MTWLIALLFTASVTIAQQIDDGRQFLKAPAQSTPIQQAAYAVATNQPNAEQLLKAIIQRSPRSPEADQAHLLLSRIYLRAARYKSLAADFDRWHKDFPTSPEMLAQQDDIEQFRGLPDQSNETPRPVQLKHQGDLWFDVTINGKSGHYLFDTGADVSILTESEARRLGLKLRNSSIRIGDSSGIGFHAQLAVAPEIIVGTTHFKNVSFVIMPDPKSDDDGPPPGGIIGLPVILGMRSLRWNRSGTADFATPDNTSAERNLVFFANKPIIQATVENRPVFFSLDTGAESTDLNRRFADEFPALLTNAKVDEASITGAGGTAKFEARKLDSLPFVIGNQSVTLKPAVVTMQAIGGIGGDCCIGNLGDEIIFSASGFFLDFTRMTLRLF